MKRIERILLLLRCLARALFYGRADKVPKKVSKIIVVPSGKLGDVVCNTPLFKAIRNQFGRAHIVAVGDSKLLRAILSDSGLVDEYLDISDDEIVSRIKKIGPEVAIITGPSFKPTAIMYIAGVPLVIAPRVEGGVSPNETRPFKFLQRLIKTFPYKMGEYAPRERLRALEPVGITTDDTKKHLGFSKDAEVKVSRFLIANNVEVGRDFVVGISPSAGNKIKEWPEERFAEVADYLFSRYKAKILIIGGKGDRGKIDATTKRTKPETRAISITDFSIDELKALISKLHLYISVDTGPIYIAEAFDIPTVDITGPIDEREQPPRGPMHRNVVPAIRNHPELFVLRAKLYDRDEALRQIRSITVPMVKREIDLLISDGIKQI